MNFRWCVAGLAALALGACDGGTPDAPGQTAADTTAGPRADAAPPVVNGPERRILAFGDSLFAGYNIGRDNSYPAQLETALRRRGINAVVVNAGVSGDTTAAGRQRLDFVLANEPRLPDLMILELGGNDLLRGIDPDQTRENLSAMLDVLQGQGVPVLLVGLRAPPNMGADFVREFDALYPALAQEYGLDLIPFFLEPVYGRPELMLDDRIHPSAEGVGVLVSDTMDEVTGALPPVERSGD